MSARSQNPQCIFKRNAFDVYMKIYIQAALAERDEELQKAVKYRKQMLAEVDQAKEELQEAKSKLEKMSKEKEKSGMHEKSDENNLEIFKALAEKLPGETLESVSVFKKLMICSIVTEIIINTLLKHFHV